MGLRGASSSSERFSSRIRPVSEEKKEVVILLDSILNKELRERFEEVEEKEKEKLKELNEIEISIDKLRSGRAIIIIINI